MDSSLISCTRCSTPLPASILISREPGRCSACGAIVQALLFPAAFREPAQGQIGEPILVDGEASCFYHPTKRAAVPCDDCGRFLCPLCHIDFNGRHICPVCLEGGEEKANLQLLRNKEILLDSIALSLVAVSFCFWPLWIVTGPVAIVLAILSWFRPPGLIPRNRTRAVLAILLGLLQTGGCIAFWLNVFR